MRLIHKKTLIVFVFVALVILSLLCGGVGGKAYAAVSVSGYSDVLDDLEKDESFNSDDYPAIDGDYSLQVIQVAESTAGELFVYVYQPAANAKQLTATQINMSLTDKMGGVVDEDDIAQLTGKDKPTLYGLTFINASGVFGKYKVDAFTVSSEAVRYYNIASIYRFWDKDIDGNLNSGNTVSEKSFPVGQLWTAMSVKDGVVYNCREKEVITVTDKYVGMLRYSRGILFGVETKCDSHYIAFSTDKRIDDLEEATVRFTTQNYMLNYSNNSLHKRGEPENHYVSIRSEETVSSGTFGLFPNIHLWNRIQSVEDFKKDTTLNDSVLNSLEGKKWVLRFVETTYSEVYGTGGGANYWTSVSDTAILELTFVTDGERYSLGVVDNIQTGSGIPDNPDTGLDNPFDDEGMSFWEYIWYCILGLFNGTATLVEQIIAVVAIFLVVLALPILLLVLSLVFPAFGAVMKMIIKGIWTVVKYLFIGLWYVISSPALLIIWIVQKIKGE